MKFGLLQRKNLGSKGTNESAREVTDEFRKLSLGGLLEVAVYNRSPELGNVASTLLWSGGFVALWHVVRCRPMLAFSWCLEAAFVPIC